MRLLEMKEFIPSFHLYNNSPLLDPPADAIVTLLRVVIIKELSPIVGHSDNRIHLLEEEEQKNAEVALGSKMPRFRSGEYRVSETTIKAHSMHSSILKCQQMTIYRFHFARVWHRTLRLEQVDNGMRTGRFGPRCSSAFGRSVDQPYINLSDVIIVSLLYCGSYSFSSVSCGRPDSGIAKFFPLFGRSFLPRWVARSVVRSNQNQWCYPAVIKPQ